MTEEGKCIIPLAHDMQKSTSLDDLLATHSWVLEGAEPYGGDGVLTKMHCSECGLRRAMILYDIKQTVERIKKKKQQQKAD